MADLDAKAAADAAAVRACLDAFVAAGGRPAQLIPGQTRILLSAPEVSVQLPGAKAPVLMAATLCDHGLVLVATRCKKKEASNALEIAFGDAVQLRSGLAAGLPLSFTIEVASPAAGIVAVTLGDITEFKAWLKGMTEVLVEHVSADRKMDHGWLHTLVVGTLHSAALTGNDRHARALLDVAYATGLQIDALDDENNTALALAVGAGHKQLVEILLSAGARRDVVDADLRTVLHIAVSRCDADMVALLLANDVDASATDMMGDTPLSIALHLLAKEEEEAETDEALAAAAASPAAKVIHLLTTHGVDFSQTDALLYTPLQRLALTHRAELVPAFCKLGTDSRTVAVTLVDGSGSHYEAVTPLHLAVCSEVQSIDDDVGGAQLPRSAAGGRCPHPPMVAALLAWGVPPNMRTDGRKQTAAHMLLRRLQAGAASPIAPAGSPVERVRQACIACLRALFSAGARFDVADGAGVTVGSLVDAVGLRDLFEPLAAAAAARAPPPPPRLLQAPMSSLRSRKLDDFVADEASDLNAGPLYLTASGFAVAPNPVWMSDAATEGCSRCGAKFSMFNRRHHCRYCGVLACGPCSSRKFPLPAKDAVDSDEDKPAARGGVGSSRRPVPSMPAAPKDERVCDGCFNRLCEVAKESEAHAARWAKERAAAVSSVSARAVLTSSISASSSGGGGAGGEGATRAALFGDRERGGGGAGAGASRSGQVQQQTSSLQDTLGQIQARLAQRGEKVNRLEEKTRRMADSAANFADLATQLKEKSKSSWFF